MFVIGFASVAAPVPTAAVCWLVALVSLVIAIILGALNHFS